MSECQRDMPDKARRTPTYFIQCSLNGIIKSLPLSGGFTWRPSSVCLSVCLSVSAGFYYCSNLVIKTQSRKTGVV